MIELGKLTEDQQVDLFKIITGQIEKACLENGQVVALGDWNINLERLEDQNFYLKKVADEYKNCMATCGL